MLQEHQVNKDFPHQNQENILYSTPQTVRGISPMSKSDIRYDNRISMIKSNQSPRKEFTQEVSKMSDYTKKLLQMIDSMSGREAEKNKRIQQQNSIISDLKLRIMQLSQSNNENPEAKQRSEEENEVFMVLLEEIKSKQDEIDSLQQRVTQMEDQVKSIQLSQMSQSHNQQEHLHQEREAEVEEARSIINNNIEQDYLNKQDKNELNLQIENNKNQIQSLQQMVEDSLLQMRKNAIAINHLSETNKKLIHRVQTLEDEKGSGLRSFFNFLKELFIIVIISALFSGLKYYISII